MSDLLIYQIDSFTTRPFAGNPAGVIPNADGLTASQMQAIARELNNSETAFVIPAESLDGNVKVRFFTPTTEVPVCGHATIAAHFALALEGAPFGTWRQLCGAGEIPIETEQHNGLIRVWMHQRPATFEKPLSAIIAARIITALGLAANEVHSDLPLQVVSTGHSKVVVPIKTNGAVARLKPDMAALSALSSEIGCNGYYPFEMPFDEAGASARGRMFAPRIGIPEDPVTGNASGCLGAYLLHHALLETDAEGRIVFVAYQGTEVGRPGSVLVDAQRVDEDIRVKIAGHAALTLKGSMVRP